MPIESSDISVVYSGGANNVIPSLSVGGNPSSQDVGFGKDSLFQSLSVDATQAGLTDYRCVYIFNNSSTSSLYQTKIFIENDILGGGTIQLGVVTRSDIQRITIQGAITSGAFTLGYDGPQGAENIVVNYNGDLATWGQNLQTALNASNQIEGAIVNASQTNETTVFTITFAGNSDKRFHQLLILVDNSLVGTPNITISKLQDGSPINAIAPITSSTTTPPQDVVFSYYDSNNPIEIGTLGSHEKLAVWSKRTVLAGTAAIVGDGFNLRISGNPINGQIIPVNPVDPVDPVATLVMGETEMPLFFNSSDIVKEDNLIPPIVEWLVKTPDNSTLLSTEGFNIAFLPIEAGDYNVSVKATRNNALTSIVQKWVARVVPKNWTVIIDPPDLSATIAASTTSTKIVLTTDAVLNTSDQTLKGRLVGNGNKIIYNGPTYTTLSNGNNYPNHIINMAAGASIDGINYTGPFYDSSQRSKVAMFTYGAGNNIVSNCVLSKISFGTTTENGQVNMGWISNSVDRFLTNYMFWIGGKYTFIYGNKAEDSSTEHICRGGRYSWVTVANNDFRNQDFRNATPPEPINFSKSCINMQYGKFAYIYNNIARQGPISVGPLGVQIDYTKELLYVVDRKNTVFDTDMQIQQGVQYVLYTENEGSLSMIFTNTASPEPITMKDCYVEIRTQDVAGSFRLNDSRLPPSFVLVQT